MKTISLLLVTLGLLGTACSKPEGAPAKDPLTTMKLGGALLAADLPTIAYDASKDITGKANTLQAFKLQTRSAEIPVSGDFGGSALVSGVFEALRQQGTISFDRFKGREGHPVFTSGTLTVNLTLTDTTITGHLELASLVIDGKNINMAANYDLYLDNMMWRGTMIGTITVDGAEGSFTYDYDTPSIVEAQIIPLDAAGNETTGDLTAGNHARLKLAINSNAPVNQFNLTWKNPSTILSGGGRGCNYCRLGSCPPVPIEGTFVEEARGYWTYFENYSISQYQENGTYSWATGVENAAKLKSRTETVSLNVVGGIGSTEKPTIQSATIRTAGLSTGNGGSATLILVAKTMAPANWLNVTLQGPTYNIEGGGSSMTFSSCTNYTTEPGHACQGLTDQYFYLERAWTFSKWAENGTYSLTISVANEANQTSDSSSPLTFEISNNPVADTPVITSITPVVYQAGQDPVTQGIALNGQCLVAASQSDPLRVALLIVASSNAPISWVEGVFDGPTATLSGGGHGITATDLGSGSWQYVETFFIDTPSFAPQGTYAWKDYRVRNDGLKPSADYTSTLSFSLKSSCP